MVPRSMKHAFFLTFCLCQQVYSNEEDFPPLLNNVDIDYLFQQGEMDLFHYYLANVFAGSERNPNSNQVRHPLPETLVAKGGGSTYTTKYKVIHDLEQAEYLAENLDDKAKANFFGKVVAPIYRQMLDRIPELDQLERTHGLYGFRPADYDLGIKEIYNKALHHTDFSELKDEDGNLMDLLSPELDVAKIEKSWKATGVVVIDNLLTPEALARIRQLMLESTVFFQTKMPLEFGGYVGAYIDDGLHDRILLQLAWELYNKLPLMKGHFLQYLWAYKYDSEYSGINIHADQAAVNVNIWLTPDDANLDPSSGGLVVYTAKPPADWDFNAFNTDTEKVHELLLKPTGYANVTVPYRQNRAVLFDSALFHNTDTFSFKKGYTNRRINLTFLYGDMQSSESIGSSDGEL